MATVPIVFGRKLGLAGTMGALLMGCAFAPSALANQAQWLAPVSLSTTGQDAQTPAVAMDGNGDSEAVWTRSDGTNPILQTSFREAGPGDTFAEQDVNDDDSTAASAPQVAEDPSGGGEALWLQNGTVNWSWRTNDSSGYGEQATVSGDTCGGSESDPKVAVDSNQHVVAVWLCDGSGTEVVEAAYASGSAGDLGTPVPLSDGDFDAANPQIAEDPNGDATVAWQESNGANSEIEYAYRPVGQSSSFTAAQAIDTEAGDETSPTLAMDGSGNAAAAWLFDDGPNEVVQEADGTPTELSGAAGFNAQTDLTADGHDASAPMIADDSNGDTAVAWARFGDMQVNVRPSGDSFSSANTQTLGAIDSGAAPQIAITANQDPIAVWQEGHVIESESGDSGGTFSPSTFGPLSTSGAATSPSLAVDHQGNAVADWLQSIGGSEIVMAAGYDGTGPIGQTHLEAAGVAGRGLSFYARASDVWPAITSFSWNFGDGTADQTGANVVHTFAAAGTYTVTETVTASDGNTSSTSKSITIAASAAVVPEGGLEPLASPNDCVTSSPIGCGTLTQPGLLDVAYTPVTSPDGKNVYEVGNFGGLVEFSRNATTGVLTEIGCITGATASEPGCTTSPLAAMDNPASLAISPDGADVYVVTQGENAILTLSRSASTGLLTEVTSDCYDSNATAIPGCTHNPGLQYPWGAAVSSDGKSVYATSNDGQDIAEFTRSTTTGALTPIAGNNCISDAANPNGCQVASALGLLNLIGVVADGSNVYGVAGGGLANGDVAEFIRNASTGALSAISGNACIGDVATGCPTSGTDIDGTEDMAIGPDGQYAYINSSNDNAIVELHRNTVSGALTQIGCVGTSSSPAGLCGTSNAVGINDPLGVAISPDGTNLYVSGAGDAAEAAFAINNTDGLLTQLPAPFNCITLNPSSTASTSACGTHDATGLNGARRIAISPDGKDVYVAGQGSAAVAEFARTPIATRAASTTGTEASWDSNDPASSIAATITVPAVNCSGNPSGAAGQQEGVRLIGSVSSNEQTSFPAQAAEVLTYCNGKTPTYSTEFVVNDVSNDTETYEPAGLPVSPGDPLQMSLSASFSGATLQITDVNTGATRSVSGPGFEAVNGFDTGTSAIPGNGHGAPMLNGSEPDTTHLALLPGPVQALPAVFTNVAVGDPPLSSAPGLYQIRWVSGGSTAASPSPVVSGGDFASDISSVPPPVTGKSGDVAPVSGKVLIKLPGTHKFVRLTSIKRIPNGTIINAIRGRVQISIEEPNGTIETGVFFDGEFKLVLSKSGMATAKLVGGSFRGCPKPPRRTKPKTHKKHAGLATVAKAGKKRPKTKVRSLWSNAHGSFGTSGQYGASAVRGTEWLTVDQCDGTFFRVTRDEITVTSFTLHHRKTIVKQGHSFLAPAPGYK